MTIPAYGLIDQAFADNPNNPTNIVSRVNRRRELASLLGREPFTGYAGAEPDPNQGVQYRDDASARDSFSRTMSSIERALEQPNLSPKEIKSLQAMAKSTFREGLGFKKDPIGDFLGGTFSALLERPSALVQMELVDLFGGESFTHADYGSVLTGDWDRLARKYPEVFPTGNPDFDDFQRSIGWVKPADRGVGGALGGAEGILRTVAGFAGEVFTDPLTYVTLGGGAVGAGVRKAETVTQLRNVEKVAVERIIAETGLDDAGRAILREGYGPILEGKPFLAKFEETIRKEVPAIQQRVARELAEEVDHPILKMIADGESTIDDLLEEMAPALANPALHRKIVEEAGLKAELYWGERTALPAVLRDFAKVDPDFAALRKINAPGQEGKLFPRKIIGSYNTGGIRFGGMFGGRSFAIPGTRGLGRNIQRALLRSDDAPLTELAGGAFRRLQTFARAAAEGKAGGRISRASTRPFRRVSSEAVMRNLFREEGYKGVFLSERLAAWAVDTDVVINHFAAAVHGLRKAAAESGDDPDEVFRAVIRMVEDEAVDLDPDILRMAELQRIHPNIGSSESTTSAAVGVARTFTEENRIVYEGMLHYRSDLGNMGGSYIPNIRSEDAHKIVGLLAREGIDLGFDPQDQGLVILGLLTSAHQARTSLGEVAASRHLQSRELMKGAVNIIPSAVDDLILIADPGQVVKHTRVAFGKVGRANEVILPALERVAERHPELGLRKLIRQDGFRFFEEDITKVFLSYHASMRQALMLHQAADEAERLGMIITRKMGEGYEEVIHQSAAEQVAWYYHEDPKRDGRTVAESMGDLLNAGHKKAAKLEQEVLLQFGDLEFPVSTFVSMHPEFRELQRQLRTEYTRAVKEAKREARRIDILAGDLKRQGLSPEIADMLASGQVGEVLDTTRRLVEMADEMVDDFQRVVSQTVAGSRMVAGVDYTEATRIASQRIDEVRLATRRTRDEIRERLERSLNEYRRKPSQATHAVLTTDDLVQLEQSLRLQARRGLEGKVESLRSQADGIESEALVSGRGLVDFDGVPNAAGRKVQQLRNQATILERSQDPDFAAAFGAYRAEAEEAIRHQASKAARHMLEDIEGAGLLDEATDGFRWPDMTIEGRQWTHDEITRELQTLLDEMTSFNSPFFGHPVIKEMTRRTVDADGASPLLQRLGFYQEAAAWDDRSALTSYFRGVEWNEAEWATAARPQANPFAAIRRGDFDAVGRWIKDTDPKVWAHVTEQLHDIGMSTRFEVRPYHHAATGETTLRLVDRDFLANEAEKLPSMTELVALRRSGEEATTGPLAHPDVLGAVDSKIALEDAKRTYESAFRSIERRSARLEKEHAEFGGAIDAVGKALETSLRGTTPTARRTLRAVLYDIDSNTGKWSLSARGQLLRRNLPDDEFYRLHNNAEYLAVLGEFNARTPSVVRQAVKDARTTQDFAATMFDAEEAARRIDLVSDRAAVALIENQESLQMLEGLMTEMKGLRKFYPDVDTADGQLAMGRILLGSDPEAAPFVKGRERAAELVDILSKRTIMVEKTDSLGRVKTVAQKVFTEPEANRAREALKGVIKPYSPHSSPTGRAIDFGTVGLGSGPLEGKLATSRAVVDWFASYVDISQNLFTSAGMRELKEGSDRVLKYWKRVNTTGRPFVFNERNLLGAMHQNMLGGIAPLDPIYLQMANLGAKYRRAYQALGSEEAAIAALPKKWQPMMRAIQGERGVLDGYAVSMLQESLHGIAPVMSKEYLLKQAWKPWHDGFAVWRGGAKLMETVEDTVRLALFAKRFNAADPTSAASAAAWVRALHFDYSDLTTLERRIQKVLPFWVWWSRNLQLQMRVMVERPEMIMRYHKLQSSLAANYGGDADPEYDSFGMPDWWGPYAAQTEFFLRKDSPYWARLFFDVDTPTNDLLDSPLFTGGLNIGSLATWLGNALGPQFDIATQFIQGEDQDLPNAVAPWPLAKAYQILDAVGLDPIAEQLGYRGTFEASGQAKMAPAARNLFDTFVPWWRNIIEPLTVPEDPRVAQRIGYAPGETGLTDRLRAFALEQAKGFGVRVQTPVEQPAVSYRIQKEIDDILERLQQRDEWVPPAGRGSSGTSLSDIIKAYQPRR